MAVSSKILAIEASPSLPVPEIPALPWALEVPRAYHRAFVWFQLSTAYVLLECALWSSRLSVRNRWALIAMAVVAGFAAIDRPSLRRLGLGLPSSLGASLVLAVSFVAALILIFTVYWAGGPIPANATWPSLRSSWQYVIWALMQEFILQSFFFTRCEELFGSSKAVWVAATLFAAAHLPSPLLTTFTLVGGLFFCEMFRRYRSIYPIGIVHAALGLTIAMTMPDSLLHHMRVGIGYLRY
jgi:membrane protease YdiL (CAAX protease family)